MEKVLQYQKGNLKVVIEYDGISPALVDSTTGYSFTIKENLGVIEQITITKGGRKEEKDVDRGYPDKDTLPSMGVTRDLTAVAGIYDEKDIDNAHFPKYANHDSSAAIAKLLEEKQAPEQVSVTNENDWHGFGVDKPRLRIMENLLNYLPEDIKPLVLLFEKTKDVFTHTSAFPDEILESIESIRYMNEPILIYLGEDPTFTYNMSYMGIRSLFKADTTALLWVSLREMRKYVNSMADLSLYDNNISLKEIMLRYNTLRTNIMSHYNGRYLFNEFVTDNNIPKVKVTLGTDIYDGYLSDRILFVPDVMINYLYVKTIDVMSDIVTEELFVDIPEGLVDGEAGILLEFNDIIIDNIRNYLMQQYEKMFLKYSMVEDSADV